MGRPVGRLAFIEGYCEAIGGETCAVLFEIELMWALSTIAQKFDSAISCLSSQHVGRSELHDDDFERALRELEEYQTAVVSLLTYVRKDDAMYRNIANSGIEQFVQREQLSSANSDAI